MKHVNFIKSIFAAVALLAATGAWARSDTGGGGGGHPPGGFWWQDPKTGYSWGYDPYAEPGTTIISVTPKPEGHLRIPSWCSSEYGDWSYGGSVVSIGSSVFWGCSGLTSVTIPDSVETIGSYAFRGCSGLTSVTIPDSVTSIGEGAFAGCNSLTNISVQNGNEYYMLVNGMLLSKSGKLLYVVKDNGNGKITIPDSVTSIGEGAFSSCSGLLSIEVGEGNAKYRSEGGLLLTKDGKTLVQGVNGNVTIPDGVTSIRPYAFAGCSRPTSVTIPDSVTRIVDSAFRGCRGLASVTIPSRVAALLLNFHRSNWGGFMV